MPTDPKIQVHYKDYQSQSNRSWIKYPEYIPHDSNRFICTMSLQKSNAARISAKNGIVNFLNNAEDRLETPRSNYETISHARSLLSLLFCLSF
jgi:hypothetical protein